jgi:hypothetical protein
MVETTITPVIRNIERIEKNGDKNILGIKSCKSFRKALQTLIGQYYKKGNTELEFHTKGILDLYNKFHPEKSIEVKLDQERSKSTFEVIDKIDKIIVIKYQKINQEEMKKFEIEIEKEEIKTLIKCILKLSEIEKIIKTKYLAISYSSALGLNHSGWMKGDTPIFSDRTFHYKLTIVLNVLNNLRLIEYKNGKTIWLNNKLSFQESLDNYLSR